MSAALRPSDPRRLFPSASLRCRRASPPRAGLQLARCSRRFRLPACGRSFNPPCRDGPIRSGHARETTFVSLRRSASDRCIRLAHRFVPPVQPAARQAPRIADRAAKHDQDTELLAVVESFFSTIFRVNFWGKDKHFFSSACQIFRKITDKLLAGISTIRSSPRAFFRASGAISRSISRTPQRGSRAFRLASNASFDGAV